MLNKKYYAYAVSLAIFSFSQIAADSIVDTVEDLAAVVDVRHEKNVIIPKQLKHLSLRWFGNRLFQRPSLGMRMYITMEKARNVIEIIQKRKERVLRGVIFQPHQSEVMLGIIDTSDGEFIAKSIDSVFEMTWDLLEAVRYNHFIIAPVIVESVGDKRLDELFIYRKSRKASGNLQDTLRTQIKTIDQLESILVGIQQLFKDILFSVDPATKEKIMAVKAKIMGQEKASKNQEVASVRDN